jgi:3-oxoacyl-[acyl-carrier protein] reductase
MGLNHESLFRREKAIVCGSTDGIGKASAIMMAERGAEITLVARNENKLNTTILELSQEQGQKHSFISADFNNPDELKQKIHAYFDQAVFPVHILVNNSSGPDGGYFGA